MMIKSGLSFVLSNLSIDGDLPYELAQGHVFRRAKSNEIEIFLSRINQAMMGGNFYSWPRYDCEVVEENRGENATFRFEEIPEDQWRYWVLGYEGNNSYANRIQRAAYLLETDFDMGLDTFFSEAGQSGKMIGYMGLPLHLLEKYSLPDEAHAKARVLRVEELGRVKELIDLERNLQNDYEFVSHALRNYESMRMIPRHSELRVVGYFAIIEALITHPPRLTETLDSINHQIRNKAILIRKRFEREINLEDFFLPCGEEKAWSLLYSYRSNLAHGSATDFQNKFRVLKNQVAVVSFLREFLKELLKFALRDPEFLGDLKRC